MLMSVIGDTDVHLGFKREETRYGFGQRHDGVPGTVVGQQQ